MEPFKELNLQRKIEKIAQAIYLVSNHLKDTEPLKWELRKEGVNFLTCIRSMGDSGEGREVPPDLVVDALSSCARDLTSYLSLAVVAGLISRNNGAIVMHEIELLQKAFEQVVDESTAKAGFVLSEEFFATDPLVSAELSKRISKGQNTDFLSDIKNSLEREKKLQLTTKGQNSSISNGKKEGNIKDKKDDRQSRIIALLKNQENLTIKDFVKVIDDCSEKTIQRELISLVEKGIVRKEGERRWSTYSLK